MSNPTRCQTVAATLRPATMRIRVAYVTGIYFYEPAPIRTAHPTQTGHKNLETRDQD